MHAASPAKPAHALPRVPVRLRALAQSWPSATGCKTASRKKSSFSRLRAHARCVRTSTTPKQNALFPVASVSGALVLRFPGQYADDEAGTFYNLHREYLAGQGRYTQADPTGLDGGWSRFAYVDGNPLSYTDVLGLRRGGNGKGPQGAPTIGPFGCVFGACASSNNTSSEAQLSFELTLGGGLEICDAPMPKPETQSCEKSKNSTVVDPGGPPIPKKFGGVFFGIGIKSDGSFCVRVGPHVSVPFAPSISKPQ